MPIEMSNGSEADCAFMQLALREAEVAAAEDEVPIGAVIVHDGRVIASAHNQREQLRDPTAHAEMIAITQAAGRGAIGGWKTARCTSRSNRVRCAPARWCWRGCRGWCTAPPIRKRARPNRSFGYSTIRGSITAPR